MALADMSDRQLLEAIYVTLSEGLERVEAAGKVTANELTMLRAAVGGIARQHEATAGKVDALITDVRNLGAVTEHHRRSVDGRLALARERIAELEERIDAAAGAE